MNSNQYPNSAAMKMKRVEDLYISPGQENLGLSAKGVREMIERRDEEWKRAVREFFGDKANEFLESLTGSQ
jgi:hypothetical protein